MNDIAIASKKKKENMTSWWIANGAHFPPAEEYWTTIPMQNRAITFDEKAILAQKLDDARD